MKAFFTEVYTSEGLQNGRHFADDKFEFTFSYENCDILIHFLFKFILNVQIKSNLALVQIMVSDHPCKYQANLKSSWKVIN